jgi:hypothetical protein
MNVLVDWLVDALGGSRYLEGAYSLRHDNVLLTLYTAEYLVLGISIVVIGACLIVKRGRLTGVNRPAAALYGLTFLFCGAFYVSNLACLFLPIYRLDVIAGACAAMSAAVTAGLTVQSLFGHTPEFRHA